MPSLPIEILPVKPGGYHPFINLSINGIEFRMIVDTGASRTVLDHSVIEKLQLENFLETSEDKAIGLGSGEMETQLINLEGVELAGIQLPPLDIGVLNLQQINDTYEQLDLPAISGMLGNDLLLTLNAVIDYGKREIRFRGE